jgi:hypothetical protein
MFFDKHNIHMLRILLTDSGQYILPIDGQYETPLQQQQQDNVHFYRKNIYSQSRKQWTDLHSNVHLLFQYNQTSGTALMEPEQGEPKQSDIDVNNKDRWELDEQNGKITKIHARPLPSLLQEMNIVPSQSSDLAKPERPTFSTTVDTKRRRLMNGQMIVNNHFFMINGQDQQPSP